MSDNGVRDVIIIGGGPAGYTAALYAARANLKPLVIEGFNWGGQLMITSDVENYPGYTEGVLGPEMMADFRRQAERFGAEFLTDDVTRVDFSEQPLRVYVGDDEYTARSVIVATGASARRASRARSCGRWRPTPPTTSGGRWSGRRRRCCVPPPWRGTSRVRTRWPSGSRR